MEEDQIQDDLAAIRDIMERSQKFISLSGLSGILAGIYALVGAAAGYFIIYPTGKRANVHLDHRNGSLLLSTAIIDLLLIAAVVLAASLITGFVLTKRQAERKGQAIWGRISRSLLFYMAVPLVSGGALIFILLLHHHYGIVSAASLIFYGLALVSASNFTFSLVKYLGICEIILGLIAACLPGYGLLFWAIGFGALHIIYGSLMYLEYDR